MKTIKHIAISGLVLVLVLGSLPACKRKISGQPDPLGPSSVGVVLNITSTLNAIFAGNQRQSTVISAVLKKFDGTPIGGKTVYFQVGDVNGNRMAIGFFDSNATVANKVTDGGGNVSIPYFGPLSQEIEGAGESVIEEIYIWASVSWEGAQSIQAATPIQIIRDDTELLGNISANPNVLFAGKTREMSTITAVILSPHQSPLAGRTVYFEILNPDGERVPDYGSSFGFFEGNKAVAEKVTGPDGSVRVNYYGPLASERQGMNVDVTIRATVAWEGKVWFEGETPIRIIADATALNFTVDAYPSVLYAGTPRPESQIKAIARYEGAPISNRRVYFTILQGPGFLSGNKTIAFVNTGPDGVATITYFGPTRNEIFATQNVVIQAQLETSVGEHESPGDGNNRSYDDVIIRIVRD